MPQLVKHEGPCRLTVKCDGDATEIRGIDGTALWQLQSPHRMEINEQKQSKLGIVLKVLAAFFLIVALAWIWRAWLDMGDKQLATYDTAQSCFNLLMALIELKLGGE